MSWYDIAGIVACILVVPLGIVLGKWLKYSRRQDSIALSDLPVPNFDTQEGREMLRMLIARYGIIGSCDIRDGQVYRARRPGETESTAAALMGLYRRVMEQTKNENLMLYTQQSGVLVPLGIEVSMLRDIAQMLEDASGR